MPTPRRNDERSRCTHQTRIPGTADTIQCGDAGHWTLDKKAKTWRPSTPADKARRCWAHGPGSVPHTHGNNARAKARPNARTQRTALRLLAVGAEITKARTDVDDELSMLGFPSTGGGPSSNDVSDPVGTDATRISVLTEWREDLRDAIETVQNAVSNLISIVAQQRRLPPAMVTWRDGAGEHTGGTQGLRLCCDALHDRPGSIEWGDPTCTEIPTTRGLCTAHYHAERRWRADHDLEGLEEPAA